MKWKLVLFTVPNIVVLGSLCGCSIGCIKKTSLIEALGRDFMGGI